MTEYCKHGTLPTSCWICKCKELEAVMSAMNAKAEEMDDYITELEIERDDLMEALEGWRK